MSKLTLTVVLELLSVLARFIAKALQMASVVVDLVDDGFRNHSSDLPEWMCRIDKICTDLSGLYRYIIDTDTLISGENEG